jgi:hypothetical protein
MRFVPNRMFRGFSRSLHLLVLVAITTIVTPNTPLASRDAEDTGSGENPAGYGSGFWFETDSRKRATANFEMYRERDERGGSFTGVWLTAKLKPSSGLQLQLGPSVRKPHAVAQWVDEFEDEAATATYGKRYVFADLRQTEFAMVTRVNWILSPRMSLQVYAQPLISTGDYTGFKEFAVPRSFEFARYGVDRGQIAFDPVAAEYTVDPDGAGSAPSFTFGNPDFNFKSLRLNAIFRWEWRPGSAMYLVWTEQRQDTDHAGSFAFSRDVGRVFAAPADDVFLFKIAYWFQR